MTDKNKKSYVHDTKWSDFQPTLNWPNKYKPSIYRTVKDPTTDYLFLADTRSIVREKFLHLIIYTPILHGLLAAAQIIYSFIKLLYDLIRLIIDGKQNLNKNANQILKDFIVLILAPLCVIALELTAINGLMFPLNSRKMFSSTERFISNTFYIHNQYNFFDIQDAGNKNIGNKGIAAPCFQPKQSPKQA